MVNNKMIVINPAIKAPESPFNPRHITATVPDPTYASVIKKDFFKALTFKLFKTHVLTKRKASTIPVAERLTKFSKLRKSDFGH
jgi:hypothetical protein